MSLKVIVTGSSGFVGEGVLLECLSSPLVKSILIINRKNTYMHHPKIKELIVPNFLDIEKFSDELKGYDICFYCAGISSVGISEEKYFHTTYTTTLHFAETILKLNPSLIFNYVSGSRSDSTEQGKVMWARVKGKTENALMKLPFKKVYNFRPAIMKASLGQTNMNGVIKILNFCYPILKTLFPKQTCLLSDVGKAMIKTGIIDYPSSILEVSDIKKIALSN